MASSSYIAAEVINDTIVCVIFNVLLATMILVMIKVSTTINRRQSVEMIALRKASFALSTPNVTCTLLNACEHNSETPDLHKAFAANLLNLSICKFSTGQHR